MKTPYDLVNDRLAAEVNGNLAAQSFPLAIQFPADVLDRMLGVEPKVAGQNEPVAVKLPENYLAQR